MTYWIIPGLPKKLKEPNVEALQLPKLDLTRTHGGARKGVSNKDCERRGVAAYVIYKNDTTNRTLKEIATLVGYRNHSTVLNAVDKVEQLLSINDQQTVNLIKEVKEKLYVY